MNKNLMILTIVLLAGTIWAGNYSGGSGTQVDPYQISTVGDWQELMTTSDDWDRNFVLINDLDLADINLIPVGEGDFDQSWNLIGSPFNGIFDGQGYLIQNASIVTEETNFIGVFNIVGPDGVIRNLGLENIAIQAGELSDPNEDGVGDVGGLAGFNNGTIINCYVTGTVSGGGQIGGLAGSNSSWGGGVGIIENCYAIVSVSGQRNVGGLVGEMFQGYITESYAAGAVSASHWSAGGLVGTSDRISSISISFWDMDTSGQTNSGGGTGLNTLEMHQILTYENAGWDLTGTWRLCEDGTYPSLLWESARYGDFVCPEGVAFEDLAYLASKWLQDDCGYDNNHCGQADMNRDGIVNINDFTLLAKGWFADFAWADIEDNAAFNGQMRRYQTTNAQFARYLNNALASGDIILNSVNTYVLGARGSNPGIDYPNYPYYRLDGLGFTSDGATNGGKSRINYSDGQFTVDSGFQDHPVTYVSWFGAIAFASYHDWRLPNATESRAVASYNNTYTYSCGNTINNSIANYFGSHHPHGTTPVGQYGLFGYGVADMAGNVYEWTSSSAGSDNRIVRGGSWIHGDSSCLVSHNGSANAYSMNHYLGFRVCR